MAVLIGVGAVTAFWAVVYFIQWLGRLFLLGWLEPRVYEWLHLRALDRALGKPYGTMAMRRKLDQRDADYAGRGA